MVVLGQTLSHIHCECRHRPAVVAQCDILAVIMRYEYNPDTLVLLMVCHCTTCLLCSVQDLEESSGVGGRKDILPIKNLSEETQPTPEAAVLVCRALQQALYAAVDYLREYDEMSPSEADSELS